MLAVLRIARAAFWLAVAVYLGGMVALGMAAPVVFRTLRGAGATSAINPQLQDPSQLAGEVFGNMLHAFSRAEMVAAAIIGVAILIDIALLRAAARQAWNMLRVTLFVGVLAILLYEVLFLTPAIWQTRAAWRAAPVEEAPAKHAAFTTLHKRSESLAKVKLFLLAGVAVAAAVGTTQLPAAETKSAGPA